MAGDGDKADGLQHFEFSVEIGYYTLQFLEFNLYLKFDKKIMLGCFMEKILSEIINLI